MVTGLSGMGIEVDHIKVSHVGFAGFMVKTDPTCDSATWRENFVMRDIKIHDNYSYYTEEGEGFYIGYTFSDGVEKTCDGQTKTLYGHLIENLQLYNNRTEDTGSEGIQVGSSPGGMIYDNDVYKPGQRPFADYQNNGIQIGYHGVTAYSNRVEAIPNNGIIIFGTGHKIYNNLVISAGAHGVFADDRATGEGLTFVNNTIISPAQDGLALYYDETTTSIVKNNLFVNPGGEFFRKLNNNVIVDESNNINATTVAEVKFVDPTTNNYHLLADSDAVDAGTDVSGLGVTFDLDGVLRPQDSAFDVGAYEYSSTTPVTMGSPTRTFPTDGQTVSDGLSWQKFTFEHSNGIQWYGVWVGPGQRDGYSTTAHYNWYEASVICNGSVCTLPDELWLTDGTYEWWMTYWSPDFQDYTRHWNRTTFTMIFGQPTLNRDVPPQLPPQALTWTYDGKAQWYQVWVGPDDYSSSVVYNWFDAREKCSASLCTLDVNPDDFAPGNYEWYMEVWGPGAYLDWGANGVVEFTVP